MKPAQSGGRDYAARIRRAQRLASTHLFATEVLTFYQKIAEFQKNIYAQILRSGLAAHEQGQLRSALNLAILLPHFPEILAMVERSGPAPVRDAARQLSVQGQQEWSALLTDFWTFGGHSGPVAAETQESSGEPLTEFILRAFLQPYAEFLGAQVPEPPLATSYRECPRCGSAPLLGVLRPEGDGGKRHLMCSFCLQEWEFRRIYCAACGEAAEQKLPVYVAEQFRHIRVEACETCKFYVRTIDLTTDGNAVPMVDDLAAIPLSLWADEHGYTRLQGNLLGT